MFKAENGFTNLFSAFQYLIDLRKATISYSQAAGEKCILPLQPEAQKNQGIRAALASAILLPERIPGKKQFEMHIF